MTDLTTRSDSSNSTDSPASPANSLSVTEAIEREGHLEAVLYDPATLLLDGNVRRKAQLGKRFVDSVKRRGVLNPVIAVLTADGGVRVRMGQRRTLAALEAGRQVPVIIVGNEATDDAAAIERILDQVAENDDREALTAHDHIGAAEELALFGMPAADISRNLHMPRKEVDAALTVARSPLAKAATERYEFLSIPQALVVAEFDDDPATVKVLIAAAKTGDFEHTAQRVRDERADQQLRAASEQALTQAGVNLVEQDTYGGKPITSLTDDEQTRDPITAAEHAACPGHGAYLTRVRVSATQSQSPDHDPDDLDGTGDPDEDGRYDEDGWHDDDTDGGADGYDDPDERRYAWVPVFVCREPARHQPRARPLPQSTRPKAADMEPAEREEAARERREVVQFNKEWESAQKVRLAWLGEFAARQRAPKGTNTFLAAAMAHDGDAFSDAAGNALAARLLGAAKSGYGRSRAIGDLIEKASEQRAQVIHLVMVLAIYEAKTQRSDWREQSLSPRTRRYLRHLAALGYPLSPVEQRAATERATASVSRPSETTETVETVQPERLEQEDQPDVTAPGEQDPDAGQEPNELADEADPARDTTHASQIRDEPAEEIAA